MGHDIEVILAIDLCRTVGESEESCQSQRGLLIMMTVPLVCFRSAHLLRHLVKCIASQILSRNSHICLDITRPHEYATVVYNDVYTAMLACSVGPCTLRHWSETAAKGTGRPVRGRASNSVAEVSDEKICTVTVVLLLG